MNQHTAHFFCVNPLFRIYTQFYTQIAISVSVTFTVNIFVSSKLFLFFKNSFITVIINDPLFGLKSDPFWMRNKMATLHFNCFH